ncbi:MAG: hypothetical protein KF753_04295 [Caldilineaceae bacterium]|nr:hypothetical protein [Caldilineaceae bacterium]
MPRGKLNEKYVQETANAWLLRELSNQTDVCAATCRAEVRLNPSIVKYFGRADGLVAILKQSGEIYTASLEAKSSRTWKSISASYSDRKWAFHILTVGILCLILGIYLGTLIDNTLWFWVLAIAIPLIGMFVYTLITAENKAYRTTGVIDQIRKYPANEQWIALSTDLFNRLSDGNRQLLLKDCRAYNIGILCVSPGRKVRCVFQPLRKTTIGLSENHLASYASGGAIHRELMQSAEKVD